MREEEKQTDRPWGLGYVGWEKTSHALPREIARFLPLGAYRVLEWIASSTIWAKDSPEWVQCGEMRMAKQLGLSVRSVRRAVRYLLAVPGSGSIFGAENAPLRCRFVPWHESATKRQWATVREWAINLDFSLAAFRREAETNDYLKGVERQLNKEVAALYESLGERAGSFTRPQ